MARYKPIDMSPQLLPVVLEDPREVCGFPHALRHLQFTAQPQSEPRELIKPYLTLQTARRATEGRLDLPD